MTGLSYDRYGLTGNPFRDLISDTLADVEVFHVGLEVDGPLTRIKEEIFDKENRAMVAIVGPIGAGKTERLRLAASEASRHKTTAVYVNVPERAAGLWKEVADALEKASELGGFAKIFSAPKWYRQLATLQTADRKPVTPKVAAQTVAAALNDKAPAMLLLNDLQNLKAKPEIDQGAAFLQDLTDLIQPGVLVMFACSANFYVALSNAFPALSSRVSRVVTLPTLTNEQAALLIAKKLLAKRIVEALDPLFPYDREAVDILNKAAFGNPRRLLEMADLALEQGLSTRSCRGDSEIALAAVEARRRAGGGESGPAGSMRARGTDPSPPAAAAPPPVAHGAARGPFASGPPDYLED